MAKLRKMVTYTDYRWEETEELTPEQVEKWKSGDEDLQEEVLDEVDFEFDLARDKCLEDSYFREKYESCHDGKYPNEEESPHIVDVFGADAELFIDRVGSKWITQYEVYYDDETSYEFGLESAWYPPSDMLKEMHRQLVAIDPDIIFTARHWDEGYDPIGVIKITDSGQYLQLEETPMSEDEYRDE